jgi:hypothetical protein
LGSFTVAVTKGPRQFSHALRQEAFKLLLRASVTPIRPNYPQSETLTQKTLWRRHCPGDSDRNTRPSG